MLFSEVYGTCYNVLAKLLTKAVEGSLTQETMLDIVREQGFEESVLTIPEALKRQTWPLITENYGTPLSHKPTMPLTTLQKRWLKALLSDPRVRLFAPPVDALEDVEPLYPADAFVYFDRFQDGDPFDNPGFPHKGTDSNCTVAKIGIAPDRKSGGRRFESYRSMVPCSIPIRYQQHFGNG